MVTIYNTTLSATSQRHFSDSLGGGIKPYVDFAEAWDTRGSASESKSPHWILLQLWLWQRRNRCLDETGQIIPVIHIADV